MPYTFYIIHYSLNSAVGVQLGYAYSRFFIIRKVTSD